MQFAHLDGDLNSSQAGLPEPLSAGETARPSSESPSDNHSAVNPLRFGSGVPTPSRLPHSSPRISIADSHVIRYAKYRALFAIAHQIIN